MVSPERLESMQKSWVRTLERYRVDVVVRIHSARDQCHARRDHFSLDGAGDSSHRLDQLCGRRVWRAADLDLPSGLERDSRPIAQRPRRRIVVSSLLGPALARSQP